MSELETLRDHALRTHARDYHFDREGYPVPVRICAKWKTRRWVEDGINCEEWFGELNPAIQCTCGADEHNAEVSRLVEMMKT